MELIWKDSDAEPRAKEPWIWQQTEAEILAAIAAAPQHWIGIRAANNPGAGAPVMSLSTRNLAAFKFAAGCAMGFWPRATKFELVASDAKEQQQRAADLVPPGMPGVILRQPVTLLALDTTAPRQQDPDEPISGQQT
jgi:hypothetical protein